MNFQELTKPFAENRVEWRAGMANAEKTKALALAYVDSRTVMERLDEVLGPQGWQDDYKPAPSGGVLCGISIKVGDEWVTKWDGAENSDIEAVKGGLSDAFKRAAVKWGIGRYLYDIPAQWVDCEQKGKSVVLKSKPKLPTWALPNNPPASTSKPTSTPAPVSANAETPAEQAQGMTIEQAEAEDSATYHKLYGEIDTATLEYMVKGMAKVKTPTEDQARKITAAKLLVEARKNGRPVQVAEAKGE